MNYSRLLTILIVLPSWGEQLEDFQVAFVATEMNVAKRAAENLACILPELAPHKFPYAFLHILASFC